MVIFAGKNFKSLLSKGAVPATLYGISQNGWMDEEIFTEWFLHDFLEHAISSRPLMLLLDGNSSHFTVEVVKLAAAHDVVIFCLHLVQQLIVNHLTLPASSHSKIVGQMFVENIYLPIQAE